MALISECFVDTEGQTRMYTCLKCPQYQNVFSPHDCCGLVKIICVTSFFLCRHIPSGLSCIDTRHY